jgi:hypothetical protein
VTHEHDMTEAHSCQHSAQVADSLPVLPQGPARRRSPCATSGAWGSFAFNKPGQRVHGGGAVRLHASPFLAVLIATSALGPADPTRDTSPRCRLTVGSCCIRSRRSCPSRGTRAGSSSQPRRSGRRALGKPVDWLRYPRTGACAPRSDGRPCWSARGSRGADPRLAGAASHAATSAVSACEHAVCVRKVVRWGPREGGRHDLTRGMHMDPHLYDGQVDATQ